MQIAPQDWDRRPEQRFAKLRSNVKAPHKQVIFSQQPHMQPQSLLIKNERNKIIYIIMAKKRKPVKKRELLNFDAAVILLAVIVIAVILKALLIPSPKLVMQDGQKSNLEDDAKILLNALTDGNEQVRLLESNELMEEKIMVLAGMDYNRVRAIV